MIRPSTALTLIAVSCLFVACTDDDKPKIVNQTDMIDMSENDMTDMADMVKDSDNMNATSPCETSREECLYPSNEYAIKAVDTVTLTSKDTQRMLPLVIRYPTNAVGKRPVVIWSHGGGYNNNGHNQSKDWGELLSRHGFVVIHVAHVSPSNNEGKTLCMLANVPQQECIKGDEMTGERPFLDAAVARPYDIIAVLDALPKVVEQLAKDNVVVDPERVAVAGWSAGSQAGLALLGAKRDLTASVTNYTITDDRVDITMGLSPQGPGFSGYHDMSCNTITAPVLLMTGDNDEKPGKPELSGAIRRQTFKGLPGGMNHQYLLYSKLPVGSGAHGSYNLQDLASDDEDLKHLSDALSSTARAFLDAYLLDKPDARTWLQTNAASQLADDRVDWVKK